MATKPVKSTDLGYLVQFRRDIHSHPELARQEKRTTSAVAHALAECGLEPRVFPTGTGVICDIDGSAGPGPTIALRADMDALPIQDTKDVDYKSQSERVCHACGHDVHTAVLLGAALELARIRSILPGRIRLIFQPAEESSESGSLDMIAGGALSGVDVIYTLHCDPSIYVGEIGVRSGPITSAQDHIIVKLNGQGGHSARPHLTTNPISVLATVVTALPDAVNEFLRVDQKVLLGFGMIQSGGAPNAIPSTAWAGGTVRIPNEKIWKEVPEIVKGALEAIIGPYALSWELEYKRVCPAVVNDANATKIIRDAALAARHVVEVRESPQSLGGEDFAWYLQHVPGALFRLGVTALDSTSHTDLHSGLFDIDESAIEVGVEMLVEIASSALRLY